MLGLITCLLYQPIRSHVTKYGNSHPSLNMLYVIKHHKHILQIITYLHLLNQIEFGHNSIDGHLEQINH
jgi:hypothetical protein